MRSGKVWFDAVTLIALVCVIASCLWGALVVQGMSQDVKASTSPRETASKAPSVSVIEIAPRALAGHLACRGVVAPSTQVEVISENTSRILVRNVQVGDTVEKGATLLELDGAITKIQLNAASAQVASAKALLAEADAELKAAEELEDDDLKDQTKARRDVAEAGLQLAESGLAEAELSHQRRVVEAPISGVISQCFLEAGEFAAAGRPVAEVVATDPVRVIVALTSLELDHLSRAATKWQVATPSKATREAKVCFTSPMADPLTRRFDLVLEVDNQDAAFAIGAKIDVRCDWEASEPELTIPRKALIWRDNGLVCFRIERAGQTEVCRQAAVRVASIPGLPDVVRVLHGLAKDDRIADERLLNLRDGLKVRVDQ